MQVQLVDGTAVRQRRRALRMSSEQVASAMAAGGHHVSRDFLYKVERGQRQPSERTLAALCAALRCHPRTLLKPKPTVADVARRLDGLVEVLRRHGIDADSLETAA